LSTNYLRTYGEGNLGGLTVILRIVIVAALSIASILLWCLDVLRPWVIQPFPAHVARAAFAIVLLTAGGALVLRRPSKAAWGFFAFSLFGAGAPALAYALALPAVSLAGAVVFALFAMRTGALSGWRRAVEIAAYVWAALAVALGMWSMASTITGAVWPQWFAGASLAAQILAVLAAPLILADSCAGSGGADRERLRWMVTAFAVNACILPVVLAADQQTLAIVPHWLVAVLAAVDALVLAAALPYAVLKEPIVDVNVAISCALAWSLALAACAGAFVLLRHAPSVIAIPVALVIGILSASLYPRMQRTLERALLRERVKALAHLQIVINGMPHLASRDKIDRVTIEEPVHSLELEGGTLLWSRADGTLISRHEFGAAPPAFTAEHENALSACLQSEKRALRLNQHGWNTSTVAVPVFSHGLLVAAALYGLHENGTDFDVQEIKTLEALAAAAGEAYDRIDADALRAQVRELREELDEIRPARAARLQA
jgi:hypothetical protein